MDELQGRSPAAPVPVATLELISDEPEGARLFPFHERIEIGRWSKDREGSNGTVLIRDATVSSLHCTVVRRHGGGYFACDLSRNGTWLDGRRLVPNVPVPIQSGQMLSVGHGNHLVLKAEDGAGLLTRRGSRGGGTALETNETMVTILVGDIRHYTNLVRETDASLLQCAVSAVFETLEAEVARHGGSVKEYQGDAIFAFWEDRASVDCVRAACRAALDLDGAARRAGADPAIWNVPTRPLRLDWALATGPVTIRAHGGRTAMGLTMIGPAVPLAFRIEKLANDETGSILACEETWRRAREVFEFRDLGRREAKGFEELPRVFSLSGERGQDGEADS